jgi:hypothetical protein
MLIRREGWNVQGINLEFKTQIRLIKRKIRKNMKKNTLK